jgi:hypothetical protein
VRFAGVVRAGIVHDATVCLGACVVVAPVA